MAQKPLHWCPECQELTVCKTIPLLEYGECDSEQHKCYEISDDEICFFLRARRCENCSTEFLTYEIDEYYFREYLELKRNKNNIIELCKKLKEINKLIKKIK